MISPSRVVSIHPVGTPEYAKDKNKLLPDDKTCGDCIYRNHCQSLFPHEQNTYCQFYPNKFVEGKALKLKKKRARMKNK